MAILVTGGAGYIGSHTALELMRRGKKVIVYDNLQKGHTAACIRIGAKLITGDIRDTVTLSKTIRDNAVDHIIHFAAESLVGESMKDPLKYYDNNVYGTCCLLKCAAEGNVKGIVFSSTAAVYGEPEETPLREDSRTHPTNTYGETKLAIERMLEWVYTAHGINHVALRYFNAAGADDETDIGEDHRPETHLIPLVLKTALGQRASIDVYGSDYPTRDGTCVRDYIHVNDLADAHIRALSKLEKGESAIYNLGNGIGFTVLEVIEAARRVTGRSIPTKTISRRAGDPATLVASSQKVKEELGWEPRYPEIEQIIESAWKWHRGNPQGYAD